MTVSVSIKRGLSLLLSHSGLLSLLETNYLRKKALVLMYHRVLTPEELYSQNVQPGMYVLRSTFERQIAFLKNKYRILFLEDLKEKKDRGEDIAGCCSVTFDDGWRDNYANAFPILLKYQIPATIFLSTGFVGTDKVFWPEEMSVLLRRYPLTRNVPQHVPTPVLSFHREIGKKTVNDEQNSDFAIELLKKYSPEERDSVLDYFRGLANLDATPRRLLSWEEVSEMGNSGLVRFGGHTVGHEILDQIPAENARIEIMKSKETIETKLGIKAKTFAYPNGNNNEEIRDIVRACGFDCAVTTRKGLFTNNTRPFEIPRIGMHEDVSNTIPMFRSRILFRSF